VRRSRGERGYVVSSWGGLSSTGMPAPLERDRSKVVVGTAAKKGMPKCFAAMASWKVPICGAGQGREEGGVYLVGGVSVSGNTIRTDDDTVDAFDSHQVRGHGVRDERPRQAVLHDLEGGEARTLVVGPGLAGVDVLQSPHGMECANYTKSCAKACCGEGAGVADREDLHFVSLSELEDTTRAVLAHRPVGLDVFLEDGLSSLDVAATDTLCCGSISRGQHVDELAVVTVRRRREEADLSSSVATKRLTAVGRDCRR
jgi:hypothetical protein